MNWLDVTFIIITIVSIISGVALLVLSCKDYEVGLGVLLLVGFLILALTTGILPFIHLDKGSGSTIGIITSVDKNFFGTTALYIKTSETTQEKYCIEFDEKLEEKAKELIGKSVKVSYGERVGFYSTGRCSQAPIEKIEEIKQDE